MTSQAIETQGAQLWIGDYGSPTDFVQVKEMVSFQAFDGQANEIDVTNLDSTAKEFRMGLQDWGNFAGEFNYLEGDAGHTAMLAAKASRLLTPFKFVKRTGAGYTFSGFVTNAPTSGGVDAKQDRSFSIRISGDVTPFAAP